MWWRTGWFACCLFSAAFAFLLSPSAEADKTRDLPRRPLHVVSVASDSAGNFVLLNLSGRQQLMPPLIHVLPGEDGESVMAVDFLGVVIDKPMAPISTPNSTVKSLRIGQFNPNPPVMRLAFSAADPASFKKIDFRAQSGSLIVKLPPAAQPRRFARLSSLPASLPPAPPAAERPERSYQQAQDVQDFEIIKMSDAMPPTAPAARPKPPLPSRSFTDAMPPVAPDMHREPVPVAHREPVPAAQGEPVPAAQGEPVPAAQGEPVPAAQGEPVPAAQREPVPAAQREPVPVANLEPIPRANGDAWERRRPAGTSPAIVEGTPPTAPPAKWPELRGPIELGTTPAEPVSKSLPGAPASSRQDKQVYGPPEPIRQAYGPPEPVKQAYGPPEPVKQAYGPPEPVKQAYGPPEPIRQAYGPPEPVGSQAEPVPPVSAVPPLAVAMLSKDPLTLKISASSPASFKCFRLNDPERFVVDVTGKNPAESNLDAPMPLSICDLPMPKELVKELRSGSPDGDNSVMRLVLDLASPEVAVSESGSESNSSLTLTLQLGGPQPSLAVLPQGLAVVLDAGHGGSDPGAQRGDIQEKEITLGIVEKLKQDLEQRGIRVSMTRQDDSFVSLDDRVSITNRLNPNIFLSVHINSLESNNDIHGIETYFHNGSSKELADFIHASLVSDLAAPDRGIRKARFYVINHTPLPAVLAEVGFISNQEERAKLISSDYQRQVASALAEGVILYLSRHYSAGANVNVLRKICNKATRITQPRL
jgi:N-acetylmuramoyl-L-alanine amidase